MDGTAWSALGFGLVATVVMSVISFAAAIAAVVGRTAPRARSEDRSDRAQRLRTVRDLLDAQRSWFAALDIATLIAAGLGVGLLSAGLGSTVGHWGLPLALLIVGTAYLVFAQALPVAMARSRPVRTGRLNAGLGDPLGTVFRPFASLIHVTAVGLDRLIPNAADEPVIEGVEDEIRHYIAHEGDTVIQPVEREMIDGVLHLEDIRVRELMVPRVDIVAIARTTPFRDIMDLIVRTGHSRIPVYEDSLDRVIGVLYAKDLLPFVLGNTDALPLVSLLRPPYVVPESKRVNELLADLRKHRVHMAIVADEYGGTAGIVTIEDILEEIVGEIQDEYDQELPLFEFSGEGGFIADGRLAVQDAEDTLGVTFEDDDFDTLGGFVQKHLGRLPQEGDEFTAEGVEVQILEVERHRVRKMRVRRLGDPHAEDEVRLDDAVLTAEVVAAASGPVTDPPRDDDGVPERTNGR